MKYKVDNAIILAAGFSSRFAPLSYEKPKALVSVRGEVLIERQIRQLHDAKIRDVVVVVGYKKEEFQYLREKFGVILVENTEYRTRNNHSSIKAAQRFLGNSYICSCDNYFAQNPFENEVDAGYYSAEFSEGNTTEWCLTTNEEGWITKVTIGGCKQWYMLGHAFWNKEFSTRFLKILNSIYDSPETTKMLWESIYAQNLADLKLKIRRYPPNYIFEFDSLDELRAFDSQYISNTGSRFIQNICMYLNCSEEQVRDILPAKTKNGEAVGFFFKCFEDRYYCRYVDGQIKRLDKNVDHKLGNTQ